jgi:hypothetical protein
LQAYNDSDGVVRMCRCTIEKRRRHPLLRHLPRRHPLLRLPAAALHAPVRHDAQQERDSSASDDEYDEDDDIVASEVLHPQHTFA